jgi:Ca2+:H+ antiporter
MSRETPRNAARGFSFASSLAKEWPLLVLGITIAGSMLGKGQLATAAQSPALAALLLVGLSAIVIAGALAIVRHADVLAHRLGEPGGTLLLTMAITGLEAAMVGLVMSSGEEKPTLARDTMFAVIMLVLNGYLGLALVLGGVRHNQQAYNPDSANAFLVMIIPLSVLSLVLPDFTRASPGPTLTAFQMAFLCVSSVAIYAIFLLFQTRWNRELFVYDEPARTEVAQQNRDRKADNKQPQTSANHNNGHHDDGHHDHGHGVSPLPTWYHGLLLAVYGAGVIVVAKGISLPLDALVLRAGAPVALAGFVMAMLVLTPESIAAVRAARRNQLQRCVNVLLGSVLASIGLTVPIVVVVALFTGRQLVLGLEPVQLVLLVVTLLVSMLTFARPKTNLLMGSVHLLLFAAAAIMIFDR